MAISWLTYDFEVYDTNTTWNDVPGLYIFTGLNQDNLWVPLYVGQAGSFADRLPGHERWEEARQLGATHVHARVERLAANRDTAEALLIEHYQPVLNVQHR